MIQFIIGLLVMFLAVISFTFIRKAILKTAKKTVKDITGFGCSIGNIYKKDGTEPFIWQKFKKALTCLSSGGEWGKSIKEIIDIRKFIIYTVILSCIFSYGYFKGKLNSPVKIKLSYDKEWVMNINGEELYKPKFSNNVFIRDSKTKQILKQIKAKDMGALRKKLNPISFQLKPIFVAGGGIGEGGFSGEVGAGVSWLRMWQYRIDTFLTQKGIYLGTSYRLKSLDNSAIGIGVGKGFKKLDNRVIFYWRWNF